MACVPYYRCQPYIRRAVEGLLAQSHRNLRVVVLNDADDETPPWPVLADITDSRLLRYDLHGNRGPYFATQALLMAMRTPYLLIQDADDWSHPQRAERLLGLLLQQRADLAISAIHAFHEYPGGSVRYRETLWRRMPAPEEGSRLKWRIHHCGLYRKDLLMAIGGYYGGMRMNYDAYITSLIQMTGRVTLTPLPLYHYYIRPRSLTTSAETGLQSERRRRVKLLLQEMYSLASRHSSAFSRRQISFETLASRLRKINETHMTVEDRRALQWESGRLRLLLREAGD